MTFLSCDKSPVVEVDESKDTSALAQSGTEAFKNTDKKEVESDSETENKTEDKAEDKMENKTENTDRSHFVYANIVPSDNISTIRP